MKKLSVLILILSFYQCSQIKLTTPGKSQGDDLPAMREGKELAQVNNKSIREGYLQLLGKLNPRLEPQLNNPFTRKQLLDNLIDQEIMYQESVRRGLAETPEVKEKIALYKRVIISQSLLEDELDKKTKEYYESNKDKDFTKVHFSQIQINFNKPESLGTTDKKDPVALPTETTPEDKKAALTKAEGAKKRSASGEDFEKLVEELSDDKISKNRKGEMGAVSRNDKRMARLGLDKLVEVAFQLKSGEVSDLIETAKGYHLIKVTSEPTITPYNEAKKLIEFQLQKEVKNNLVEGLKKNANITFAESEKPEVHPPMPPTGELPPGHPSMPPAPPSAEETAPAPAPAPAPEPTPTPKADPIPPPPPKIISPEPTTPPPAKAPMAPST